MGKPNHVNHDYPPRLEVRMKVVVIMDTTGKDDTMAVVLLQRFVYDNSLLIQGAEFYEIPNRGPVVDSLAVVISGSPLIGMAGN